MNNYKTLIQTSSFVTSKSMVNNVALILLFSILTAIGAWIEIPTKPVPFTLQTFFVLLSGALLGARKGFITQLLYLSAGAVGIPVFAGFSAGLLKLIGPTGGYLLSFPLAALVTGYLIRYNTNYLWTVFSVTVGMIIIFTFGTLFLNFAYFEDFSKSFAYGFLIFSWWDAIKVIAVATIYRQLKTLQ